MSIAIAIITGVLAAMFGIVALTLGNPFAFVLTIIFGAVSYKQARRTAGNH